MTDRTDSGASSGQGTARATPPGVVTRTDRSALSVTPGARSDRRTLGVIRITGAGNATGGASADAVGEWVGGSPLHGFSEGVASAIGVGAVAISGAGYATGAATAAAVGGGFAAIHAAGSATAVAVGAYAYNVHASASGQATVVASGSAQVESRGFAAASSTPIAAAVDQDTLAQLRFESSLTTDDIGTYSWTASSGNVARSTGDSKYGVACAEFSTPSVTTDTLRTGVLSVPVGGFPAACVEGWLKLVSGSSVGVITMEGWSGVALNGKSFGFSVTNTDVLWVAHDSSGTLIFFRSVSHSPGTAWHHYAISFDGSTYRLFVDGSVVDSFSSSTKPGGTLLAFVSSFSPSGAIVRRYDHCRWSSAARYTSAFTPAEF